MLWITKKNLVTVRSYSSFPWAIPSHLKLWRCNSACILFVCDILSHIMACSVVCYCWYLEALKSTTPGVSSKVPVPLIPPWLPPPIELPSHPGPSSTFIPIKNAINPAKINVKMFTPKIWIEWIVYKKLWDRKECVSCTPANLKSIRDHYSLQVIVI